MLNTEPICKPELDPGFIPAVLWNRSFREKVARADRVQKMVLGLEQTGGALFRFELDLLPETDPESKLNFRFVERFVKFILWSRGGNRLLCSGAPRIAELLAEHFAKNETGQFDAKIMGDKIYAHPFEVVEVPEQDIVERAPPSSPLGGHLNGCRIGFDLGGSDRKCAAVIDGEVVFSEEVKWDPYFQDDPQYHLDGINDTLKRAADKLPRVDAIGGSAAGVYVNNEVRVASLFRGVSAKDFEQKVRRIFFDLQRDWNGIPFEVVNDGEVTALAGSLSMSDNAVLGIAMGTSLASGYVNPEGKITSWLNELAFAPIDYRRDAARDEWSRDIGCGVQYFSQQAVVRLAKPAGLELDSEMPFAEQLIEVQNLMDKGDERARSIYKTIGTYLGYTAAHYADFYQFSKLLILGRVASGPGGAEIIREAKTVLEKEFPILSKKVTLRTPSEQDKRHGQAVAAASLPPLP